MLLLDVQCPRVIYPLLCFTSSSDLCKSACFQKVVPSLFFRKLHVIQSATPRKKLKFSFLLLSHILLTKFVSRYHTNWVLSVIYPSSGTKRICLFSESLSRSGVINLLFSCLIPAYFVFYASCLSARDVVLQMILGKTIGLLSFPRSFVPSHPWQTGPSSV